MPNARRTWPFEGQASSPPGRTLSPDSVLNSDRSLGGPFRLGTAPGVGPRGALLDGLRGRSDFGMDRPIYDAWRTVYPVEVAAPLLSRERNRRGR